MYFSGCPTKSLHGCEKFVIKITENDKNVNGVHSWNIFNINNHLCNTVSSKGKTCNSMDIFITTVNAKRFAGLNKYSWFQPYEVFHGNTFGCFGQQCLFFKVFMGKFSQYSWKLWKQRKFSPANLSTFTVISYTVSCQCIKKLWYVSYRSIKIFKLNSTYTNSCVVT